jgi:addiction module HigA family antidote
MSKNGMRPVHPGEVLREDYLVPLDMSVNARALALHVPATRLHEIVKERRSVTAGSACRLARYFGSTPEFWLNLQAMYDLKTLPTRSEIDRKVEPRELSRASCVKPSSRDNVLRPDSGCLRKAFGSELANLSASAGIRTGAQQAHLDRYSAASVFKESRTNFPCPAAIHGLRVTRRHEANGKHPENTGSLPYNAQHHAHAQAPRSSPSLTVRAAIGCGCRHCTAQAGASRTRPAACPRDAR